MAESVFGGLTVVLTDHPWGDTKLEASIIEGAGHRLVVGAEVAGDAAYVEQLVRSSDPAAILTCWAPVDARSIAAPSRLAIVARLGVGLDNIAVEVATERGAWVTNVPDYCVNEVSDHALALALDHCRGISRLNAATKSGGWRSDATGLRRIADLTVGILGYGRIGRETARKFAALGCRVMAYDPFFQADATVAAPSSLTDIAQRADILVLHVPLTAGSAGMIDRPFLQSLRRRPLLVNVSRGPLVDNAALLAALDDGRLGAAALDVIDGEPAPPEALIQHSAVVVTPHVAYASDASMSELRRRACEEVVRVLAGGVPEQPRNTPRG